MFPIQFDIYYEVIQKPFWELHLLSHISGLCSSSVSLEETQSIAIVNWILNVSDFADYLDVFHTWFNFMKVFLDWSGFISITITFVFNIIVAPKIIYSLTDLQQSFSCSKRFLISIISLWFL